METNLRGSERVLDALGNPTRRRVLAILRGGAKPVGEIARRVPVSRPAVSQHLRVLSKAGLVRGQREGARRLYAVDPAGLEALRAYLELFWDTTLAAYKDKAEKRGGGR